MSETATSPASPDPSSTDSKLKIYFLPNLFTAGNLFCGFLALTRIVETDIAQTEFHLVREKIQGAIFYIFLACIFDLFDGRVARMGGFESPFGREFDSLADLISFGAAPAFLVHRIVLNDVFVKIPQLGWFIAAVYLICGALRLARFNCLAAMSGSGGGREFMGFPIPAAAGLVASITLFLLWYEDKGFTKSDWRYMLPGLMIFLSIMMVSEVKYPSFKSLDLRAIRPFTKFVIFVLFLGSILILWEKVLVFVLPVLFTTYLVYGFIRPRISRKMRREIEDEPDDDGGV